MRTRNKWLLTILALVIVGALAVLVPAHRQVRAVEPALPTLDQLRTLLHQPGGPVALRYLNTSEQATPEGTLTHSVFLIEWPDGSLLIIDTGMPVDAAARFGKILEYAVSAEPAVTHGSVAQLLGERLNRVKAVAYTHLHSDHTQGTTELCKSGKVRPQLLWTRLQATEHNFTTSSGAELLRGSCLQPTPVLADTTLALDGFPGFGVIAVGGHTPDSTAFVIAVGDQLYVLSGDTTNSKAEMRQDLPKSKLYSYVLVPEHIERLAMLRKWFAKLDAAADVTVIVSHDLGDIRASGIAAL